MKRFSLDDATPVAADPTHFDGTVTRRDLIEVEEPFGGAIVVDFEPGARTHWHSHPDGQYLYVLSGQGRIQSRGGEVEPLQPGDCIYAAPGEEHWHGAGTETSVSHLAVSLGRTRWFSSADAAES